MPQKLNKAGKMQDYIPKGNGDASGEYGTSNGTNKNFTTSDKKSKANVITENKSVAVENKGKTKEKDFWQEKIDKIEKTIDGLTKADEKGNKKPIEDLEKQLQDAKFNKDLVDAYKELEELEKSNNDGSLDSMIEEKKTEMKSIEENYKEWKKTGLNVAQQEDRDKENARKTQANIIDNDLTGKKEETLVDEKTQKEINDRISGWDNKMRYMMLSRMQSDVKYYLGAGGRSKRDLWAQDEKEHIAYMETLYNGLKEKPEWLSKKELENYKKELLKK